MIGMKLSIREMRKEALQVMVKIPRNALGKIDPTEVEARINFRGDHADAAESVDQAVQNLGYKPLPDPLVSPSAEDAKNLGAKIDVKPFS